MALSIQEKSFNMGTICDALGRVRTEWFRIGVRLGIPRHVLKQFKRDEEDPLSAVVECCLQGNATEATKPFSWQSIVEALKSDYVGEPGLAEEISKKYCQPEETEVAESTDSSELKQEPTESNNNEIVRDKPQQMNNTSFQEDKTVEKAGESSAGGEPEQTSQQENSSASTARDSPESAREPLDPKVKMDLEFILKKNLKNIIRKYGSYVDTLRAIIEEKGVSPEALQAFLLTLSATSGSFIGQKLTLFSDKETELEKCLTVTAIFKFLTTKCASFLNYEVFQDILEHYKVVESREILNYREHLKNYIKKHKISEFVKINPLVKKKNGSIELIIKFDIETTCRLAKVTELTTLIAEIMDLNPSALQIVDIEDGCVVLTYLIPPSVAEVIFTPDTVFTPPQQDKLRAGSVLWIKCNGRTFDFKGKSEKNNKTQKKLEEQVTCSVCLGRYTDPKLLQCHHTYCQRCLHGLVQQDQQGQLTLTCPTCRQVTIVPASGVAGLQADFRANELLEIVDEEWRAGSTAQAARPEEVLSACSTILTPHEHKTVFCPQHDGIVMELYCETCDETICWKCAIKDGKHYGHNYEELGKALKQNIPQTLAAINEAQKESEKALGRLDARCDEISHQQAAIEEDIHNTKIVDVKKIELISQLYQLTQAKFKNLTAQRDRIETIQAQLNRHLHSMRETSHQPEAMLRKITAVKQVKELTTSIQPGMFEPNTEADIKFYASISNCTTDSQSYGLVIAGSLPFKCPITEMTPVGTKSTALLETVDSYNQPLKVSMDSITCELVSEQTGTRVEVSVERRGQNQYQISYQPTIRGRFELQIKVEGQPIRGSPFFVNAWSPAVVEDVGTPIPILTIGGVTSPHGVAVNQKREVIVTEYHGHCVTVFSPSGGQLRSFGTRGSGLGQFNCPDGVAVDVKENILVADTNNHRIQKFTAQGKFLTAVGTKGTGPLQFKSPQGIAFNTYNGIVYVVDWGNDRIQILSPDLSYLDTFGKNGSGLGMFHSPQHVACDSTGNVYVADRDNHRIQVFTADGKFLKMFGRHGEGRGEVKWPYGVAIDSSDRVYVSELGNNRVSVFSSEGQFVTSFGSKGKGPEQFDGPNGIVGSCGVVYVCDTFNNRVQLF